MDKLAIIFPGQGSQKKGMGKEIVTHFPVASRSFEEASDTLGIDMKHLCFQSPVSELTKTENAQPAILTLSVAKYRIFKQEIDIEPSISAGHSLGEYSALVCSGTINFRDALKIVRKRGQLMSHTRGGNMAAVSGIPGKNVQQICDSIRNSGKVVTAANFNSSDQIVISGTKEAVQIASAKLSSKGAVINPLRVSGAFHSPLMQGVAREFEEELKKYKFTPPKWNIVSNYSAKPYLNENEIPDKLLKQITSPVLWHQSMEFIISSGVNTFIELGSGESLIKLLRKDRENLNLYGSNTREDLARLQELNPSDFTGFVPAVPERCLAMAICTKNNNPNPQEYKDGVLLPVRELKDICFSLKDRDIEPDKEQMDRCIELLKKVFLSKKTPPAEQKRRIQRVIKESEKEHLYPQYS